jgi:multiple sugar transport system permease protein
LLRRNVVRLLLVCCALAFALPYLLIVTASFRSSLAIQANPLSPFGGGWSFENYRNVAANNDILRLYLNSVIVTCGIVGFQLLLGIPAAFALGHLRPPGGRLIRAMIIGTLSIPIQAIAIRNYLTISDLGLVNTRAGLVVPFVASAFGIYLMSEYAASVPKQQLDSAKLFGLGVFSRFRHIVFPHMKPGVLAFAAFSFVGWWNEFFWPFIVLSDQSLATVPFAIQTYVALPTGVPDWGPMMAAGSLALLPLVFLLVLLQRSFARTLVFG